MIPRGPNKSYNHLIRLHESYQNIVPFPLPTSIAWSGFAISLYFSSFFHIQDPKKVIFDIDQKDSFLIRRFLIQLTQSKSLVENLPYQFQTTNFVHIFKISDPNHLPHFHATFALCGFRAGPDQWRTHMQRNAYVSELKEVWKFDWTTTTLS